MYLKKKKIILSCFKLEIGIDFTNVSYILVPKLAVVPVPFMCVIGPVYFFDNWKKINTLVTVRYVNWNALFKHIFPLDIFLK